MKKKILSIFMLLTFALMIVACGKEETENPDQTVFDQAYQALTIVPGSDLDKVTNSFDVSTTLRGGVTAKWTSDKPATAAIQEGTEGTARVVVTRPESDQADVTVKLTAKLTYKEITKDKEFTIVVLKKPVITGGYTIAQLRSGEAELDSVVTISSEVTIVGLAYNGYTVFDGTTALFVFTSTAPSLKVGDKGVLYGTFAVGFDTNYQLTNATFEKTEEVENITAPEVAIKDLWLGALENDAAVLERHSGENSVPNFVTVEGKVALRKDLASSGNYQLVVFDTAEDTATSTKNFVRLYYRDPLFSELYALQGKEVKLTLTVNSIRRDRNTSSQDYVYEMNITSYQLLEELTDQEKVNVDIEVLELNTTFIKNGNLNLVTKGVQGSTIGYTFKDASDVNKALINLETGEVVLPTKGQVKVVIVATAKMNDATKSKEFTITIGEPQLMTIDEMLQQAKDEVVKVKGTILRFQTSDNFNNSAVYIEDKTGVAYLHQVGNTYTDKLGVGKTILVEGTVVEHNGVKQLINTKITATDEPAVPITPKKVDRKLEEADIYTYVTITAYLKANPGTNRTIQFVNGEIEYTAYLSSELDLGTENFNAILAMLNAANVGDKFTITGIVGHYNKAPQILIFSIDDFTKVEMTNEEKIASDSASLLLEHTYTEEVLLPTLGANGSTITWAVDPASSLVDGKLVLPAEEGSVSVVVTATLTLGGLTETKIFDVILSNLGTSELAELVNAGGATISTEAGTNYADKLGLNPEIFTVNFDKGSSTTAPAIRTEGGMRLYYNAAGGNFMTVTISEAYLIKSVVLEFSTNKATGEEISFRVNDVQLSKSGIVGNAATNDKTGTNWVFTDSVDVNSNSFVIQNMNLTNVQLWIWSVSIKYELK